MAQVHIDGGIHKVEIEHDSADLSYVIEKAKQLWDDTKPPVRPNGLAMGYTTPANTPAAGAVDERP